MRSRRLLLGFVVALVLAAAGAFAYAEVFRVGNLVVRVDGGFKPKKLPKRKMAPIKLRAAAEVKTVDGSTPPIVDQIVVDFDKNGRYFNKGFPTCNPRKLVNRNTKTALRKCRKALIGRGKTRAIIDFPDQEPFEAVGPLLVFNGPNRGRRRKQVIFHVYANVPLPTAFVVPGRLTRLRGGRFGTRLKVRVPTISGGSGRLVAGHGRVGRTYRHRGKRRSILNARCANGRLIARGRARWRDGTRLKAGIVRRCKVRR